MRIFWDFVESLLVFIALHRMNWFDPVFMDLSIFLLLPLSVESVSPKGTLVWVGLVVSPTVWALERVQTWFSLLCLKFRRVHLLICFAIPSKFAVILRFVRAIIFDALGSLNSARESCVAPLPAVLALGYAQVHISTSDGSDIPADVEASVY